MRVYIASLLLSALALAQPLWAEDQPVVVELYTSQGCSACPPADEILAGYSNRNDIIALALHVDYWDYLGWKDNFASEQFSKRQRAYAIAAQRRTVYTPQMIIQGASPVVGNRAKDVTKEIIKHSMQVDKVDLEVARNGNELVVSVRARTDDVGHTVIQLVRYLPEAWVNIRAGENAGRKMRYTNIVTEWVSLTEWDGTGELTARTSVSGDQPIVILVQSVEHGPILAAEVLR
jgi:hypothetical protein